MKNIPYFHVDVFAARPFTGNSLAVFSENASFDTNQMLAITQEMRHFETIFLEPSNKPHAVKARVFDLFEELDFAGHPVLGASAVLHHTHACEGEQQWTFNLPQKTVTVISQREGNGFRCVLDQGPPKYLGQLTAADADVICQNLNLAADDLAPELPLEVVSTGLAYLIVPVRGAALAKARILSTDFGALLKAYGAKFVYVLDIDALEGRTWNNDGMLEDVATGSAAGTVGAYLAKHGHQALNKEFILRQGSYVGRPSEIRVRAIGLGGAVESVYVGGDVALVAACTLLSEPERETSPYPSAP